MQSNYIYSKTAAAGMFPDHAIKSIEIFHKAINVHFFGHRPQLVSKKKFLDYFAQSRRERGQKLKAHSFTPEVWQVESGHPRTRPEGYLVTFKMDQGSPRFKCECHDYAAQMEHGISTPCCKHIYSVLDHLGFDSYHAWIGQTDEEMRSDRQLDYEDLCDAELVELCEA
jgi:hypothetical protein